MTFRTRLAGGLRPLGIGAALACLMLAALLPAVASAAPRPITLWVPILDGFNCLEGRVIDNGTVNVTLRSSTGNIDGVGRHLPADPDGFWSFCIFRGAIHPGDSITVRVVETGQKRTAVVPQLSVRVDRDDDTVKGFGPANETLAVYVSDFQHVVPEYEITENAMTNGSGRYSIDFSNQANLVGDAFVAVSWENAHHDIFEITAGAPFVTVSYKANNFEGETNRGDRVRVTLKNSNGDILARGDAVGHESFQGSYFGRFHQDANHEYEVKGGETVMAPSVGSDTGWVVPHVDGAVNVNTDVVTGTCFPDMPVFVLVFDTEGSDNGFMEGAADGSGSFSIDLTAAVNIRPRFVVNITCLEGSGDRVMHEFIARRSGAI